LLFAGHDSARVSIFRTTLLIYPVFFCLFFLYKVFSIIREFCSLGLFGQLNKSARSPEEYTDIHPRICVQQATQKSDIDIWVMYAITLTGIPYTSNTGSVLNQQIIAEITP
jgi:hypothetical protein